jgi:hypothetical protein
VLSNFVHFFLLIVGRGQSYFAQREKKISKEERDRKEGREREREEKLLAASSMAVRVSY